MAIKKRATTEQADQLAKELSDKTYGSTASDKIVRTTISLPESLLFKLEDVAVENKRSKVGPPSVSAIVRTALSKYLE